LLRRCIVVNVELLLLLWLVVVVVSNAK